MLIKRILLFFSGKKRVPDVNIMIGNTSLERADSTKFLGVIIDERLTFLESKAV